jgi:glycerol-3-phosphate dehydrogenase
MVSANLDLRDRIGGFASLEGELFDLLIIGAGITGCGVARDASMRGFRVALIDAADIGAGTSSRSSKLIHGGSRYLAQGDIMVVRQAANERRILRSIIPHLSITNPMVIPAKSWAHLKAIRAAMWTYEKLGNMDKTEFHEVWDPDRIRSEEPCIRTDNLAGAVVYPEYLTDDARLTLANARSAASYGALIVTYAAASKIIKEKGRVSRVVVKSMLHDEFLESEVRAKIVINAAGPWVDAIRLLEDENAKRKLQLTKGIHIVMPRRRLPISKTIIMYAPDKRGLFVVPHIDCVYLGTTDTFYPAPEYWPIITKEDINYLLTSAIPYFNGEPFVNGDIIGLWSGLRPLLGEEGKKPSEISRRDEIMEGPFGLVTVAGGKLTSYRHMAQQLVDRCEVLLGRKAASCRTADEALPGGDFSGGIEALRLKLEQKGLPHGEAERMAHLYGSEALQIVNSGGLKAEVVHAVMAEGAISLEDYWVRRSARAHFDTDGGLGILAEACRIMGELMGWSEEEYRRQVETCRTLRAAEMSPLGNIKE